jgi:hypothetical protein
VIVVALDADGTRTVVAETDSIAVAQVCAEFFSAAGLHLILDCDGSAIGGALGGRLLDPFGAPLPERQRVWN